jgi:hypothetical protein
MGRIRNFLSLPSNATAAHIINIPLLHSKDPRFGDDLCSASIPPLRAGRPRGRFPHGEARPALLAAPESIQARQEFSVLMRSLSWPARMPRPSTPGRGETSVWEADDDDEIDVDDAPPTRLRLLRTALTPAESRAYSRYGSMSPSRRYRVPIESLTLLRNETVVEVIEEDETEEGEESKDPNADFDGVFHSVPF